MIQKVNLFLLIYFTFAKNTDGGRVKVVKLTGAWKQLETGGSNAALINVKRASDIVAKKNTVSDILIFHLILATSDFNWLLTLNSTGSC